MNKDTMTSIGISIVPYCGVLWCNTVVRSVVVLDLYDRQSPCAPVFFGDVSVCLVRSICDLRYAICDLRPSFVFRVSPFDFALDNKGVPW